jgi:hypothetical protein
MASMGPRCVGSARPPCWERDAYSYSFKRAVPIELHMPVGQSDSPLVPKLRVWERTLSTKLRFRGWAACIQPQSHPSPFPDPDCAPRACSPFLNQISHELLRAYR